MGDGTFSEELSQDVGGDLISELRVFSDLFERQRVLGISEELDDFFFWRERRGRSTIGLLLYDLVERPEFI